MYARAHVLARACAHVCVCVRVRARACACACACVRVRACACGRRSGRGPRPSAGGARRAGAAGLAGRPRRAAWSRGGADRFDRRSNPPAVRIRLLFESACCSNPPAVLIRLLFESACRSNPPAVRIRLLFESACCSNPPAVRIRLLFESACRSKRGRASLFPRVKSSWPNPSGRILVVESARANGRCWRRTSRGWTPGATGRWTSRSCWPASTGMAPAPPGSARHDLTTGQNI